MALPVLEKLKDDSGGIRVPKYYLMSVLFEDTTPR